MALNKLTYVDNVTVIPASNLNAIQDEVIANGTNVASAKSEVENIRVGADGTTYASAGDAVRGQVNNLFDRKIENQSITASGNYWYAFPFIVGHKYKLSNMSTATTGMFAHTTNGNNYTYIEDINTSVLLPNNSVYFEPTVSATTLNIYANGAAIFTIEDVTTISQNYKAIVNLNAEMDTAQAQIQTISDKVTNVMPLQNAVVSGSDIECDLALEQGGIAGSNGMDTSSSTYIRMKNYFYGDGTYSVKTNGQKVYIAIYNADKTFNRIDSAHWGITTDYSFTLSDGECFRASMGNADGTALIPANNATKIFLDTSFTRLYQYEGCKLVSHQGYPAEGQTVGHCLYSSYLRSAEKGYKVVEGDLKLTSDNVPVLCHDWTFTDSVSGETITIADHTYAELQTYNYYGEKIASLDSVLALCRQYDMVFNLDQFGFPVESQGITNVMNLIREYRMEDRVIINIMSSNTWMDTFVSYLRGFYSKIKMQLLCVSNSDINSMIAKANTYIADGANIIIGITLESTLAGTVTTLESLNAARPTGCEVLLWTVDDTTYIEACKYIDYLVTNTITKSDM